MTAMEVYRADQEKRKTPQDRLPRQEYFSLLRDTLHDELMREGRSAFLDAMLTECESGKALPMIEFAALRECYEMIVEGRPLTDASEFVPHIYRTDTERFAWRDLRPGGAYRVDNPEFPQLLSRLRTVSRQMVSMRDQTIAPDVNRAAQREIDGMMTLLRTMESDNAQLRQERDELRARLAQLEEGYISDQLSKRLEQRRRQAEKELTEEIACRREEAEASLMREISDAAQRQHQERLRADREDEEQTAHRMQAYRELQTDLQAQLRVMREQLDQQLGAWKGRLHGADHRFLAGSCAALIAAIRRETERLLGVAQGQGVLTGEIAQAQAALDTQVRQLERALAQLGLKLFWPERGEGFDSRLHSPLRAHRQEEYERAVVLRTEVPGVLCGDGEQNEVLVRAVVQTEIRTEA